ncbi:hypothetical protein [Rhodoplanes azumiensis]|uniref:Uncharacterized protein n=1 Tax=Rhodoplanes azumiensis TaxID=1897628 RepID=A0ABW5ARV3_9BRAD
MVARLELPEAEQLARERVADEDLLTEGLPYKHAYDVVDRHALALDDTGERLVFGSTTGGLWVSEDQGDGSAGISHTLPSVCAVRFG